ncbi:hypothetical protein H257_06072 [Aphanomyces astaci]|uniref:Uncharacterized protein n=1 Tax=Aphanomyces astaci TaxID=112090 RepID=W4GPK0_APHAT|nr:hypothetical protein H257_06072 [Aphanomyces astaci]ETV81617.1 hypothetical protein H257_06072 [Aphanomyces astaci]|eukprot:XP_009829475.1 hypothetical protein H257_06072 [Aphanomyces astaci]
MPPSYAASSYVLLVATMASIHSVATATTNSSLLFTNATAPVVTLPVSETTSAGLPGVVYAGVAIGVLAIAGFFAECCLHKRSYWAKRHEINAGLNTNLPSNRVV